MAARLTNPTALTCDFQGNLFFYERQRIRMISQSGVLKTIAGIGSTSVLALPPPSGPALQSSLASQVSSIAIDKAGAIYFAEVDFGDVRK